METNEIIALALAVGIVCLFAIYEMIMHRMMRHRLHEARESASAWRSLYLSIKEERDILSYRVQSKECQKVLAIQEKLDDAREENARLTKLNETYKRQIEGAKKRRAASGTANTEGC